MASGVGASSPKPALAPIETLSLFWLEVHGTAARADTRPIEVSARLAVLTGE
jgi:hypothetical protein